MESHTKLFFAANLTLIIVSLFGWIIKWFYRPRAYQEHFDHLFPGQFYIGLMFLLQVLELPYLLDMANIKSLRYANAFSLLLAPPLMLIICRKFFSHATLFATRDSIYSYLQLHFSSYFC